VFYSLPYIVTPTLHWAGKDPVLIYEAHLVTGNFGQSIINRQVTIAIRLSVRFRPFVDPASGPVSLRIIWTFLDINVHWALQGTRRFKGQCDTRSLPHMLIGGGILCVSRHVITLRCWPSQPKSAQG
jgi:hypothetical protein